MKKNKWKPYKRKLTPNAVLNEVGGAVDFWTFNLNEYISVKINDEGYDYWLKDYNKYLPDDMKASMKELKAKADKDGYIDFQAWDFMKTFGSTIRFGGRQLFSLDVRFKKSQMRECK